MPSYSCPRCGSIHYCLPLIRDPFPRCAHCFCLGTGSHVQCCMCDTKMLAPIFTVTTAKTNFTTTTVDNI